MADYDLGTAHGKIVVDYKDEGTGKAAKDLDGLRGKAQQLLTQFQTVTKKYAENARTIASEGSGMLGRLSSAQDRWSASANKMVDDVTKVSRAFGIFTGAMAIALPLITGAGVSGANLAGPMHIVKSFGLALGGVPKGAEGFPNVIKKVIQLSAAISLFKVSTGLIAAMTSRFRFLGTVGGLVGKFGGTVNSLAGPLHSVAGLAGAVAFQLVQLQFVKKLIKPLLAFGGALAAVGGTVHLIGGLATSIRDLTGLVGLLPASLGAAALFLGTLKIGLSGFGAALKAIGKGDAAAFDKALKDMAPSAREVAVALRDIYNKGFKGLKLDIQQKLFAGLGAEIRSLAGTYLPSLQRVMGNVAVDTNSMIRQIVKFFGFSKEFGNEVPNDVIQGFDLLEKTIGNLTRAAPALVQGLYLVGRVGAEVLAEVTSGAERATQRFADFIGEARASGRLKKWIEGGVQAFRDLWAIVKNVALALTSLWQGLNGGKEAKSFLAVLADLTAKFNAFLRSADGQRILALLGEEFNKLWTNAQKLAEAFFKYLLPAFEKFMPVATALSGGVIDGIVNAMKILGPIFQAIGIVLTPIAPLLGVILRGMVTFAVTLAGLALAAKVVGSSLFILKSGLETVKTAKNAVSFAARLLTGNLTATELKALKFAGTLIKKLVPALLRTSTVAKGLKFGAFIALAAAAVEMDKVNAASKEGNLSGWSGELHDIVEAGKLILNMDFATIFKQMGDEVDRVSAKWANGEAPIQKWNQAVIDGINGANIATLGFFTGLPAKIDGWNSGVAAAFSGMWTTVKTTTQEQLIGVADIVGTLPGLIYGKIQGLNTLLNTKASEAWTSFKTATEAKFIELGGQVGSLPFRLGTAIGALIGMANTWAVDTWSAFQTGTETKFLEIVTQVAGLPERINTATLNLGITLYNKAVEGWGQFQQGQVQQGDQVIANAQSLPDRIGGAVDSLNGILNQKASSAWGSFLAVTSAQIGGIVGFVSGLPGRISGAISTLNGILNQKASEAWNSFKATTIAQVNGVIGFVQGIPGRIVGALGNLAGLLYQQGVAVIQGFLNGLKGAIGGLWDFVSGIAGGLKARKGPLPYDRKLLVPAGIAIIQGLRQGLAQELPGLYKMVSGIAGTVSDGMALSSSFNLSGTGTTSLNTVAAGMGAPPAWSGPKPAGSDGAAAPTTHNYNVTIPAKDIEEMKNVADFFGKVQQKARAGKANG